VPFIEKYCLLDDGNPFRLRPWQKDILTHVFTPNAEGKLPYQTIIISAVKKSGKSSLAAAIALWFSVCMVPEDGEIYVVANAQQQARDRVYFKIRRMFERAKLMREGHTAVNPLRKLAKDILQQGIELHTGVRIQPISTEAGAVAGANPNLVLTDELWSGETEADERLWTELTPVHTRVNSSRVVTSYAGYKGRSVILERLYKHSLTCVPVPELAHLTTFSDDGERIPVARHNLEEGFFCAWDHDVREPMTEELRRYYAMQRSTLLPQEFVRIHENRWVSSRDGLDIEAWDECVDAKYECPRANRNIDLFVGIDAGYARDSSAVCTVYRDEGGKLCLGPCQEWTPMRGEVLDPEKSIEHYVLTELRPRFRIKLVLYDRQHMVRSAVELKKYGVPMEDFPQSDKTTKLMGRVLVDVLRYRRIRLWKNDQLRSAAIRTALDVSPDGVKLRKGGPNARIDSVVALSMAILAADRAPSSSDLRGQLFFLRADEKAPSEGETPATAVISA